MDRERISLLSLLTLSIVTVLAITFSIRFDWPDFVHDSYGLPLTWGINTLSTLEGPVDIWSVNILNLGLDLLLWLGLILASQIIILRVSSRP